MNFDPVASVYDRLATGVFGSSIQEIQRDLLPSLPQNSDILLIGGGSGWILKHIWDTCSYRRLVFVEDSLKMLEKARSELSKGTLAQESVLRTELIFGREELLSPLQPYKVIITPFFLDLFSEEELPRVLQALDQHLVEGGYWLMVDFSLDKTRWRPIFWLGSKLMYLFFKFTCGLKNQRLASFSPYFASLGYSLEREKYRFFSFMVAQVYRKGVFSPH